jgi:hypothetical protein
MRIVSNTGTERVVDELRATLSRGSSLDGASDGLSLFAYAALRSHLREIEKCRLVLSSGAAHEDVLGAPSDRPLRNQLNVRWLAQRCGAWIEKKVSLRELPGRLPQSLLIAYSSDGIATKALSGTCALTTAGLGLLPEAEFSLIQASDTAEEAKSLEGWFTQLWKRLPDTTGRSNGFMATLQDIAAQKSASLIYPLVLFHTLSQGEDLLDEDRIVNSATGIKVTAIWQRLYRFQRDAVIGAIDKLERYGGCIIADSVGLGKTFEGLAVIKYYELRNQRVLVLCPKRLRDNWTLYRSNDRRNILASDRLNYDVLNHTDLSRDGGLSGDIDLSHVNWGNYDLVVIDESHNFRNKTAHKDHDTRYDRLMDRIIQAGVKTRVLMLSATPVNNRLTDLKHQIAFLTEGDDAALATQGIGSIEITVKRAQEQFNRWLALPEADRLPARLMDMIGFDYFKLLDLLTIARSRKHVEKYYGTAESGTFPNRLAPKNIYADVDLTHHFPAIRVINDEIRRLNLSAYALMRYVLPAKQAAYERKYGTAIRGGESTFRQADREESLIHLLRVNMLKRMESSVTSFASTVERQLAAVNDLLSRLNTRTESLDGNLTIEDVEVDDVALEPLLVGRKVKVLLEDIDRIKWRQDLIEDRDRLSKLFDAAQQVNPEHDAKLADLRNIVADKCRNPFNAGNRKVLIFTAFADTAEYLYRELAPWATETLAIQSAIVTGSGHNHTTLPGIRANFTSILAAFSPRSKERPSDLAEEGEIDLLIATDCISEGQNLQDCDTVVNYDIHWNPVRIIQRFGRIDRLGSINDSIQLVNFWPNMELEEYINLEQRVSGRMVLLDVSSTGEENLIAQQSRDSMNDLEYRRKQLLRLKDAVLDLEDLSSGVSIADLTLNDFRRDLAEFEKEHPGLLAAQGFGTFAPIFSSDPTLPPGVIFCLQAAGAAALQAIEPGYPLAPFYLVHVGDDGQILQPYTQARQILDRLKRLCVRTDAAVIDDREAWTQLDKDTGNGEHMERIQGLLAKAIAHVTGKGEERALASLFTPGGTHAKKGEFAGMDDYEVMAYVVILDSVEAAEAKSANP